MFPRKDSSTSQTPRTCTSPCSFRSLEICHLRFYYRSISIPGFDSLLVFVDRFTKMIHLVPCLKSIDAPGFARYFLENIIRLHGITDSLISDRGSIFTSHFWSALSSMLNVKKRLSTSFPPQTDGQTERMNQTIFTHLLQLPAG